MTACYGCKKPRCFMTECCQQLWAQKKRKVNSSTKTVWFATNNWSNWVECLQSILSGCPVVQCPEWRSTSSQCCGWHYGWEAKETKKCLIPRNLTEQILNLVKCGRVSQRPCKEPTVVASGTNFLVLCTVHVVVVMPAWMLLTHGTLMRQSIKMLILIMIMMKTLKTIAMMRKTMCIMYVLWYFYVVLKYFGGHLKFFYQEGHQIVW